jgi:hypothetical protein
MMSVVVGAIWALLGLFSPWWSGWQSAAIWSTITALFAAQFFLRGMAESLWQKSKLSAAIAVRIVQIVIGFVPLALTFHFAG